jgi:cathepsin B
MVRCLLALLVAAAVVCRPCWNEPKFISVRDGINKNVASTWKAAISTNIPYDNEEALRRLCGSKMDATLLRQECEKQARGSQTNQAATGNSTRRLQTLPTNFDLRQAYPNCWSIKYVRNQANCGSCWAVASITSISDRFCIANTKRGVPTTRTFSYQDALECGVASNSGCNGSYMHAGFAFAQSQGVVSGENYQNFTTCKPYSFSPLAYGANALAPSCRRSCTHTAVYPTPFAADKYKISSYKYITGPNTQAIVAAAMSDIFTFGSITSGYDVYNDFFYYRSGVYQRSGFNSYYVGGHAVRIVGWGVEGGIAYWLAANSWGAHWGIGGFFKIAKGTNHCRIESFMVSGSVN